MKAIFETEEGYIALESIGFVSKPSRDGSIRVYEIGCEDHTLLLDCNIAKRFMAAWFEYLREDINEIQN